MRLIDADKLIEYWERDRGREFDADYFIHTIEHAPTIEPSRPKGYWEKVKVAHRREPYKRCSNCRATYFELTPDLYCPKCGADMRGESDEG